MIEEIFNIANNGFNKIQKVVADTSENLSTLINEQEKIKSLNKNLQENYKELDFLYSQLGESYYKKVTNTEEECIFKIEEILPIITEKLNEESKIKESIANAENNFKEIKKEIAKQKLQDEFNRNKDKIDNALKEGIINLEEHNEKLASYKKKLDLSNEIIRIQEQYNLGIIDKKEKDLKIEKLLNS